MKRGFNNQMGFFNKFKKKDVPDELPDLAIDEVKNKIKESEEKESEKKEDPSPETEPEKVGEKLEESLDHKKVDIKKGSGFFDKFLEDLKEEVEDLEQFDKWIDGYWKDKKKDIIVKNLGGGFKDRIDDKSNKLHKLEEEWQEYYFKLMKKEEEIEELEKELKKDMRKFMEACNRRKVKVDQKKGSKKG